MPLLLMENFWLLLLGKIFNFIFGDERLKMKGFVPISSSYCSTSVVMLDPDEDYIVSQVMS